MKAMILAAGRGERMRPLSDGTPKPLLCAGGKPLIVHTLERLTQAGIQDVVVNHAWLGQRIVDFLGDGRRFGVTIRYSPEPLGALETGGRLARALPLLGTEPFVAINGDVYTDFPLSCLPTVPHGLAHLIMVENPDYHPHGDFLLRDGHLFVAPAEEERAVGTGNRLTFAGIGVYRPELFDLGLSAGANETRPTRGTAAGRFGLAALLSAGMAKSQVTGERYDGAWFNVGTPSHLCELDNHLGEGLPGRPARP